MKLGKLITRHDPRTLQWKGYLDPTKLPAIPAQFCYASTIGESAWGTMGNDKIGNCTCAAAAHLIMEWTDDNGSLFTPADQDVINAYAAISGYDPVTGANDTGADALSTLSYWRKNGIASHKILAYAALDLHNNNHIKQSVFLFGGCYVGLGLPLTAKSQLVWDVIKDGTAADNVPMSWGGHIVPVIGYDPLGLTIVTWGAVKKMTWAFLNAYADESYAIISTDFAAKKVAPNGFDLSALKKDLKRIIVKT